MSLTPGTRLGLYEVAAPLGAGGMGEVYRARDTRLGRSVAVKVLPDGFVRDPERVARFEREAKVLASLNHPHIATLHGLEHHEGRQFLVMELVEGETLAEHLRRGPIPLAEAVRVARQVAEALEAAHDRGLVHRDLKPANVKLTADGQVKLLDFGLAKVADSGSDPDVSHSPTRSVMDTGAGVILGTAAYMSPEQARGRPVDKRSDIWSFGCLLYEMLSGRPSFAGDTVSDIIAAILTQQPDWSRLPAETPAGVRRLLERCFEKEPRERLRDIGDVRFDLQLGPPVPPADPASLAGRRRWTVPVVWAAAGGLAGVVATTLAMHLGGGTGEPRGGGVARLLLAVAPAERLQALAGDIPFGQGRPSRTTMAWSPDGSSLVFSAVRGTTQQLYRRRLDELAAVPIAETDGASDPFFSPDGQWIGFWSAGALKKVPASGGPATTIATTPRAYGATWGTDGTIVFAVARGGLHRVSAAGGTPEAIAKPDPGKGEVKFLLPRFLPDARAVLFTVTYAPSPRWDDTEVVVQSLETGARTVLVSGAADARYVSQGYLVYLKRGTLMAAPFDRERLEITGGAVGLVSDVMQAANMTNEIFDSGAGQFSVSESGWLAYVPGGIFPDPIRQLVWVDRSGNVEPIPLSPRAITSPRLSPDGARVLFWTQGDRQVWTYDLSRRIVTRVTTEARNARAIWTPDGRRVAYAQAAPGDDRVVWQAADGSGARESLVAGPKTYHPAAWTPDGRTLIVGVVDVEGGDRDVFALDMDGDRKLRPVLDTRFAEAYADLSPDGRWLAYASDQSGSMQVHVQPFPGPGAAVQVSVDGGSAPAWSGDGRELFYTTTETSGGQAVSMSMMAVPVTLGAPFRAGTPRVLFRGRFGATAGMRGYDVTRDGRRFLLVQQDELPPLAVNEMVIVQNWIEELERRVRAGGR